MAHLIQDFLPASCTRSVFKWNVLHPAFKASTLFSPDSQSLSAHGDILLDLPGG